MRPQQAANTTFRYRYRDDANFSRGTAVIFAETATEQQIERLKEAFDGGERFIAAQIDVPSVFLWDPWGDYDHRDPRDDEEIAIAADRYRVNDRDHCWHEFVGVESTADAPTDRLQRPFELLVRRVQYEGHNWEWFEPPRLNPSNMVPRSDLKRMAERVRHLQRRLHPYERRRPVSELLETCREIVRALENPSETTTCTAAAAHARRILASYADMVPRSDLDRMTERVRDSEGRLVRRSRQ